MLNSRILFAYRILALFCVLLTIIGIYLHYSPVPLLDMWDGYLDFYVKVTDGNWHKWFAQHNEHRTIFSNVLFFIDHYFFEGHSTFLMVSNLVLMAGIAWLLISIINSIFNKDSKEYERIKSFLMIFIIIISFSWIQHENIVWGFQSQFFAAYLFPLLSFYFLVKSKDTNSNKYFLYALVSGVVSVGTMANGVLALPILFVLSLFLRDSVYKSIIILLSTIVCLYLYFKGYVSPGGHTSISDTLINHPKAFFYYMFTYLGGIFYYITGKGILLSTQIGGVFLLFSSFFFTYLVLIKKKNIYYFVILAFMLYYGGTAFGTAGGRAFFGVEQALSSRYMTPALIAWGLLSISWVHYFRNNVKIVKFLMIVFLLISLLLSVYQIRIIKKYNSDNVLDKKVAALALELGVRDEKYIKVIFPFVDWIIDMSKKPIERNLSIFSDESIKDARELMGKKLEYDINSFEKFDGFLDEIIIVNEDKKYVRVKGFLFKNNLEVSSNMIIVNEDNQVIGYVLSGYKSEKQDSLGFLGYVSQDMIKGKSFLVDASLNRALELQIYKPPFIFTKSFNLPIEDKVTILENSYFKNGTYDKKALEGFTIYGSYNTGDSDKGRILIKIKKESTLVFKTGPVTKNQVLKIFTDKKIYYKGTLPILNDWSNLELFNKSLPEDLFIELSDNGSNWGEWSGIGINEL